MSRIAETLSPDLFSVRPRSPKLMPEDVPLEVCVLFERFALDLWRAGIRRYSSDAILHRIRWHEHVDKGNREFKANDHWTAPLARWFLANHPDKEGFFTTRRLRSSEE